jgi:alpha-glucosidase (family GH31 glycosyl hydrolase)
MMKALLAILPACLFAQAQVVRPSFVVDPATLDPAPYPAWAHSHMVWLDSSRSNQSNVAAYVADYLQHNITVGGLDIDSEWSTGNNNFVVDTTKFPNMTALVADMHFQDISVILWMTSMIDTDSSNFVTADDLGYFIKNGFNQTALIEWWHGTGGFIDYGNPDAKSWWESQLDLALALGIDGWKSDGTDPYLVELITPISYQGDITLAEYQNWYYGHTFNYTRQRNGNHCIIWSRPVDSYPLILNLSAFLEFSPRYVMASGWVGDQDPTFYGLEMALINILESAWRNYANYGSDTGGYRSGERTGELLIRWAQVNAFLPLFENGGNDEHRAWMYDTPGSTFYLDIYRRLVAAHYEIGPYLLSTGTQAILNGTSVLTPQSAPPADFPFIVQPDMLSNYGYSLGSDIFVSPIVAANVTAVAVSLPGASTDTWYEYWNPSALRPANTTFMYTCPQNSSAVFVKTGSIIPLHVSTPLALVPNGDATFASAITFMVHSPQRNVRVVKNVHDWENTGVVASYHCNSAMGLLQLEVSAYGRDAIFFFRNLSIGIAASATMQRVSEVHEVLQRVEPPKQHLQRYHPRAIDWSSSAPVPIKGRISRFPGLRDSAAPLDGTWSFESAETSPSGADELIVRPGPVSLGAQILVRGVKC